MRRTKLKLSLIHASSYFQANPTHLYPPSTKSWKKKLCFLKMLLNNTIKGTIKSINLYFASA